MATPATINNGDMPDATKLMTWFNFLLAGKGIKSDTLANLDAIGGTDPFLAISTDTREIRIYLGNRALGANGWTTLGGY